MSELRPPPPWRTAGEVFAAREPLRLAWRTAGLRRLPKGSGDPVIVIPGFGASDASLLPLRHALSTLGHDARAADVGRMTDEVVHLTEIVAERATSIADTSGRPVALVGWSIGGVIARETARLHPEHIRRVITFGTPVQGGPAYTALAWRYTPEQLDAIREMAAHRNVTTPIRVPTTAIWSRYDGIVAPAACIDHDTPGIEHVEVSSTHLGMGLDPDVWRVVAERLV